MSIIQSLFGRGGIRPTLTNRTIFRDDNNLNRFDLWSDGHLVTTASGIFGSNFIVPGQWWPAAPVAGIGSGYEARMTVVSGVGEDPNQSFWYATDGVWRNMGTHSGYLGRFTWTGSVIRVEIRAAGGVTVLASADFTMG